MEWLPVAAAGGIFGLVAATWSSVKGWLAYISSWVIVSLSVDETMSRAVTHLAWKEFKPSSFGSRAFFGWYLYLRKLQCTELVPIEKVGEERLFWKGWRPIWLSSSGSSAEDEGLGFSRHAPKPVSSEASLHITFLRGTFDVYGFVQRAAESFNELRRRVGYDSESQQQCRHYIRYVSGSADRFGDTIEGSSPKKPPIPNQWDSAPYRLVGITSDEIGRDAEDRASAVDTLALSPAAEKLTTTARKWQESRDWYMQRRLIWRHGACLSGPPGTGKTSLVRSLAEEMDLPLFVFDLGTLRNDELYRRWSEMAEDSPCIALVEDIHALFRGSEHLNSDTNAASFDCLLNCISGVHRIDGILVFVTTNDVSTIDPALLRKGRLDDHVEFGPLDAAGVRHIANRIMRGHEDEIEDVVRTCTGKTGAEVEHFCIEQALSLYWTSVMGEAEAK